MRLLLKQPVLISLLLFAAVIHLPSTHSCEDSGKIATSQDCPSMAR